jgi:hypothetical protein
MGKKRTSKIYIGGTPDSGVLSKVGIITSKATSIGLQSILNIANDALEKLAVTLDVKPNKDLTVVVEEITNKLNSPRMNVLFDKGGELATKIVKTLKPALEEIQEEINILINNEIQQAEKIALDAIGMLPMIGEVAEGIRVLGDMVRAGEKVASAAVHITGVSADTVNKIKKIYDDAKELLSLDNLSNKANASLDQMTKELSKVQKAGMRSARRTAQSIHAFTQKQGYKNNRSTRKNKKMGKIGKRRTSK